MPFRLWLIQAPYQSNWLLALSRYVLPVNMGKRIIQPHPPLEHLLTPVTYSLVNVSLLTSQKAAPQALFLLLAVHQLSARAKLLLYSVTMPADFYIYPATCPLGLRKRWQLRGPLNGKQLRPTSLLKGTR